MQIAQTIHVQDPQAAPTDENGNIHEAFINHLQLIYTTEEAEVVQHLNSLPTFKSSREVADDSGKNVDAVEQMLHDLAARNGVTVMGDQYCIPMVSILINFDDWSKACN
jgi:hypothetical protein